MSNHLICPPVKDQLQIWVCYNILDKYVNNMGCVMTVGSISCFSQFQSFKGFDQNLVIGSNSDHGNNLQRVDPCDEQ